MPSRRPLQLTLAISSVLFSLIVLTVAPGEAASVRLQWDTPTYPDGTPVTDLAGYRVYYGQTSQSYAVSLNVSDYLTANVSGLAKGQTYYFAVTTYNTAGLESPFSNEVTAVTPSANFSATPTSGAGPLRVAFTDASSGSISSWTWKFGDGGTSTEQNPHHTYTAPGKYTVRLTVGGPAGSDVKTKTGYIVVK